MSQTLRKYEILRKENDIALLFAKGKGLKAYPFKVVFRVSRGTPLTTCRILVSVSKKRFHHAVNRNRVKRLVREAWRKNKQPLYDFCEANNISIDIALIYMATVIHSYNEMMLKTNKLVNELIKKNEKTVSSSK